MKLVTLKKVWLSLGKPRIFKAQLGTECEYKGMIFEFEYHKDGYFMLSEECDKDLVKRMIWDALPDPIPAYWVPPFEAWKTQPVTNFKSLEDVMNDLVKEKVNES